MSTEMRILVAGSSGLIGSALLNHLRKQGYMVHRLIRSAARDPQSLYWDPENKIFPYRQVDNGYDCVINLAGSELASGRWTENKKRLIRQSRVEATTFLSESLAALKMPPALLINASAVGYYGDRGDQLLDENQEPGKKFLAQLCVDWERATQSAVKRGVRVVSLRTAIVLAQQGGALSKMIPPFRIGLGAVLGSGTQYMSWIALDDVLSIIDFIIQHPLIKGPVNVASPHPVTNKEFTQVLGGVLKRPVFCKLPVWALRMLLGEMADEMLLCSLRVLPRVLQEEGYTFHYPDLSSALKAALENE